MNKSDIHSFDKDLPTFSTEEPKKWLIIFKLFKILIDQIFGIIDLGCWNYKKITFLSELSEQHDQSNQNS